MTAPKFLTPASPQRPCAVRSSGRRADGDFGNVDRYAARCVSLDSKPITSTADSSTPPAIRRRSRDAREALGEVRVCVYRAPWRGEQTIWCAESFDRLCSAVSLGWEALLHAIRVRFCVFVVFPQREI